MRVRPLCAVDDRYRTSVVFIVDVYELRTYYSSRTNASTHSRVVVIVDDTIGVRCELRLRGALARSIDRQSMRGALAFAFGIKRVERGKKYVTPTHDCHSSVAFALSIDGDVRALSDAERTIGMMGDGRGRGAWFTTESGHRARVDARRLVRDAFGSSFTAEDERQAMMRCDAVAMWATTKELTTLRDACDMLDARRRRIGGYGREMTTYAEAERIGERATTHFLGRVIARTFADEARARTGDEAMMRPVVWLAQSAANGVVVEVHLPPEPRAEARSPRFRDLEGAVIDVRHAFARPRGRVGEFDLVCGVGSSWCRVTADDPRLAELDARCPKSQAMFVNRKLSFDALTTALTSTGFAATSALLTFTAHVKSITVFTSDDAMTGQKIPPMLFKDVDARVVSDGMIYFGCRDCSRELKPDSNGVYGMCPTCSKRGNNVVMADDDDDVAMAFMWRDMILELRGDGGGDAVFARVRGRLVRRLVADIDAALVVVDDDDDDDDSDEDEREDLAPDYRRMVMAILNALAAGARNAPLTWVVKFPVLDDNGLPRRSELDVVDFSLT